MHEATMNLSGGTREGITRAGVIPLALKVLLVGFICHFSTEIGFAHKFPPHYISPLWPTGAILFSVLVVTPIRQWWAYTLAAYFTSVVNDARAGFPDLGDLVRRGRSHRDLHRCRRRTSFCRGSSGIRKPPQPRCLYHRGGCSRPLCLRVRGSLRRHD